MKFINFDNYGIFKLDKVRPLSPTKINSILLGAFERKRDESLTQL